MQTSNSSFALDAIIIGAGFGGIGMAVALKKARVHNFVILEKKPDVGGVWRDNSYPGAACDVPSHLYSFSFDPNPEWSRVFATQGEIHDYLRNCARRFNLSSHLRFGAEVAHARFDEHAVLWRVTQTDGTELSARMLISATGQLSRPAYPKLEGMDQFQGRSFHSANWDHSYSLANKRVAVVGTGASAIQFIPAIAGAVEKLLVFQRSPAYVNPRPDRSYSEWEKAAFRRVPGVMKLYRTGIYLRYEARALAFTRFRSLMTPFVGQPFRRLLGRQVADAGLRRKLTPDYPIGCKRILLSSEYLAAMSRQNVDLITHGIRRITTDGIETTDGTRHQVDAIVYGTGFAATQFLTPMRIVGRNGMTLNDEWRRGAKAYLGITVPGFPNFFMLYGPNTNLGHNSIVYMLESQIAHIMGCYRAMQAAEASSIEVERDRYRRFNVGIQQRLANTVWAGCKSWYVDESGNNSTNWPGFTFTYRWLTKFAGSHPYRLTRTLPELVNGVTVVPSNDLVERAKAGMLRTFLRLCFRPFIGPPWGARAQRSLSALLSPLMPGVGGVLRYRKVVKGVRTEVVSPRAGDAGAALLYLHGGAYCLGSPQSHRSITTRLAIDAAMPVWVPDYRLAPENPYPAALDDALACYDAMIDDGYRPEDIVVAGDSAGGALALALAMRLRDRGDSVPAGLMLISPVTDAKLSGVTMNTNRGHDPMVREEWLRQALRWYRCPENIAVHRPLDVALHGLPPLIIQAGDQEILLSDTMRLAEHAAKCGVPCQVEVYEGRWHVFHLQAGYLRSARTAVRTLAEFARARADAVSAPLSKLA